MITPSSAMRIVAPRYSRRAKCPLFSKRLFFNNTAQMPTATNSKFSNILTYYSQHYRYLQTKCLITQNTFFFEMESHRILESPAATIMFTLVEESLLLWSQVQSPDATIIFLTIRLVVRIRQVVVSWYIVLICHMCFFYS